jgi:pyruvate-ferredoxin/flavodoxin oxidoreductase
MKKFITCDGNHAASHIAYLFSEVAAIYPITPSSNMAENVDEWSAHGLKNLFGDTVRVVEMQSEGGASGAIHGSLQAGVLTTTFTASQGLLLMIPNMYKMAGELLPAVFHVSARSIAAHALSIFGDHSDIYATRQTGFAFLASGSVQEVMDLAGIAHLTAIKSRVPFLHFFDGFRTSHEIQKIELLEADALAPLLDREALQAFRDRALNPEHPVTRGTAQNPDIFFQAKEAANRFYEPIPDLVEAYMRNIESITGREYHPFNYYGVADAERIIIAMGSVTETTKEVVDHLNAAGEKVGLISVHLYRPFSAKYFFNVLPKTVKRIAVLDRTKEFGANGDPLYLDVVELFCNRDEQPIIVAGRYGLSSKDTTPSQVLSVFENLKLKEPKNHFTIGIVDDVTFRSLPVLPELCLSQKGTVEAKFYGLGSDGTVGANKNAIVIIGDSTDKYAQAYFAYDSKKSGGITISHLRFGDKPIRSTYLVNTPDLVACHVPAYLDTYDMLKGLKDGGTFLLNSIWDAEETKHHLPNKTKRYLAEHYINFYIINATEIARRLGLGNRTNTIMQSAFFKVSNVIPYEMAVKEMADAVKKSYGKKGDEVVRKNIASIEEGGHVIKVEIPDEWRLLENAEEYVPSDVPDFIRNILEPMNRLEGDMLPVSAFLGREDGSFPPGTSAYEKRGIATTVPIWLEENCTQCNQCAYVCPHAAIRPFLLDEAELKAAPAGTKTLKPIGREFSGLSYSIQISPLDCTGCGICVEACPSKINSLEMQPLESQLGETTRWDYMASKVRYKTTIFDKEKTFKYSQFAQPLFEFSGACSGCGETPYIKLITQLYGERMMIANATGCSSIFGAAAPSIPYCTNEDGHGPAWGNSLFEDNAEYGYGMAIGVEKMRQRIADMMRAGLQTGISPELKAAFSEWLEGMENAATTKASTDKLLPLLMADNSKLAADILSLKQYLIKKSVWIFGGDGWAYDIGYGGLDHVLASGENVNVLVLDTEVYSNTGGQSSKSTPLGAVAKFAASGKRIRKKDLGAMAMTYGYVYVAQIAMGANYGQCFRAIKEAESYPGPSLVIAYAPCISHGLKGGMSGTQTEEGLAVECGYWQLYRYDPRVGDAGKNPFSLDSKEPDWTKFQAFLQSEVRYSSLSKTFPTEANALFKAAEDNAKWRFHSYKRYAGMDYSL